MSSKPKIDTLKLNKNKFPILILECQEFDQNNELQAIVKLKLKSWYQSSFQKGNRWNKSLILKGVKNYSIDEITQLQNCFNILFNCERKYNQIFISYLKELLEIRTAEELGLTTIRIKISQSSYIDLLRFLGDLKESGEIQNSNQEIAEIIYHSFSPDIQLQTSTILDRLKNKKGYS